MLSALTREDRAFLAPRVSPAAMASSLSGGEWKRVGHLDLLSRRIRDAILDGGGREMVFLPPRNGKSELISHWVIVWFLELFPTKRVILASYEHDFAATWGRRVRNTIRENEDILTVRVSDDSSAAHQWSTTAGGGMTTAGVGGAITGKGCDLLIIDDPVKNREDADSATMRDRNWAWWTSTARTRLEPNGTIVLVQTRWHEDDLSGRILDRHSDRWNVTCFPAIADEDEKFDGWERDAGVALWPERYDIEALRELREDVGSRDWSALYQQRPQPAKGAIFQARRFRDFVDKGDHFELIHEGDLARSRVDRSRCQFVQFVDTAMKAKTQSDWTVVLTVAITPDRQLLFLDVARAKLEVPQQLGFMLGERRRWPDVEYQAVEDKGSGTGLIQEAALAGYAVRVLKADVDKVSRATQLSIMYENCRVYHLAGASWRESFEKELLSFPTGRHDDMVDCAAYAAIECRRARPNLRVLEVA